MHDYFGICSCHFNDWHTLHASRVLKGEGQFFLPFLSCCLDAIQHQTMFFHIVLDSPNFVFTDMAHSHSLPVNQTSHLKRRLGREWNLTAAGLEY